MTPARRRIILLGATGYTGQRVLRDLLDRGAVPTLVGRDRARMQAAADRFGADLPVIEVDVTSTDDLARILDANDVVVSTVGPFMRLGIATITAAARAGAHYLDSTGEGGFVRSFRHAGITRAALSVAGSEHFGLPEAFPQLESVDVGMGWLGRWTRPTQLIATVSSPLARLPKTQAALTQLSTRLPAAGREPDSYGRSLVIAVARDSSGAPLATTVLTGPDPYAMTASLLAWGAARAASPGAALTPGVHGPVTAFGLDALRAGAAEAGIQHVNHDEGLHHAA